MPVSSPHIQSYSEIASDYDSKRFTGMSGRFLFETDRRIVCSLHAKTKATRTIDVPVGTGRVLHYLSDHPIVGVDATSEMISEAMKVANSNCHQLFQGDATQLPFEDGGFDCLISLRFFHLFPTHERFAFASEFLRVVRPGGFLVVSFTNGWYAGGLNWLQRMMGGKTVHFEYTGEVKRLFPGCQVIQRVGNFLPKQWMLDRIPLIGATLRGGTTIPPLNMICWESFYLIQKNESGK
jgi:ubiquinone/menaquinone biosynthesis C-methylase UbiE